jgi:hypothetical protein
MGQAWRMRSQETRGKRFEVGTATWHSGSALGHGFLKLLCLELGAPGWVDKQVHRLARVLGSSGGLRCKCR